MSGCAALRADWSNTDAFFTSSWPGLGRRGVARRCIAYPSQVYGDESYNLIGKIPHKQFIFSKLLLGKNISSAEVCSPNRLMGRMTLSRCDCHEANATVTVEREPIKAQRTMNRTRGGDPHDAGGGVQSLRVSLRAGKRC